MISLCRDSDLDRLDYVDGARLLADDLRDTRGGEARWQALHVRALHDTWGVATGLGTTLTPNRRGVVVSAGAAFDCRGRLIRLGDPVELPMPVALVPGMQAPTFDIVLGTGGPRWEPTGGEIGFPDFGNGVRIGVDVPLGRFVRSIWGTLGGPDLGYRKVAHPMTRPRIGFGLTPVGGLSWFANTWAIRAMIDTSAAGFGSTPKYVGWTSQLPDLGGLVGPFLALSAFFPDRFHVRLSATSPAGLPAAAVVANLLAGAAAIRIGWMGVEANAGCTSGAPGGFV